MVTGASGSAVRAAAMESRAEKISVTGCGKNRGGQRDVSMRNRRPFVNCRKPCLRVFMVRKWREAGATLALEGKRRGAPYERRRRIMAQRMIVIVTDLDEPAHGEINVVD